MKIPKLATITTAGEATQIAIDWQQWAGEHDLSYGVLLEWQAFFIALADKFDLTAEFSENGII